ncbi:MAG: NAD(P)H-binding protein [Candidatus Sericytochromatia bacterium]
MSKTLILGSRGQVGSALAEQLLTAGHSVVLATSGPATQAHQVHLNLASGEGLSQAFAEVDRAFLMAPPGYTRQDELLAPVIAQAQAQELQKVVLMTAMGADANPNSPMRQAELLLENSGLNYGIIRPNWFMQNFNTFWLTGIREQQKILLPVGQAKGSFIDTRDIAAVAAVLLQSDRFQQQAFNLTGGEALNHDEVAQMLSELSGKTITYAENTPEEMRHILLKAGLAADYADFMLVILDFFKQGYAAAITPAVAEITGQPPRSFWQYATDYQQAWR